MLGFLCQPNLRFYLLKNFDKYADSRRIYCLGSY